MVKERILRNRWVRTSFKFLLALSVDGQLKKNTSVTTAKNIAD